MSRLLKSSCWGFILLCAILSVTLPSPADDKPARTYSETGTVLSTISKHGHFYQISTDSRIYLFLCEKVKSIQFGSPECKVGDKPIAAGDTVHFRIDGDWAYMPPASKANAGGQSEGQSEAKSEAKPETTAGESPEGMEEKLRILTTELKIIPPIPLAATTPAETTSNPGKASKPANASNQSSAPGVVIGSGIQVKGQHGVGWSTTPGAASGAITTASAATPVMATAPVTAIPVTGGAPVTVIPTGPTTGGVVTGVPVTGGAPITAIPTAPVMGTPVGGAPASGGMVMMGGSRPQWVHVLRIQTAGKIYQLEGSTKPGKLADKEIALGDALMLHTDKKEKHAYLSANPPNPGGEQEYKILSVTDVGSGSKPQ